MPLLRTKTITTRVAGGALALLMVFQSVPVFGQLGPIIPTGPVDILPPVPVSDGGMNRKEVGLRIGGIVIPGLTLDALMIAFTRPIIEKLMDDIVDWINSGFKDGPFGGPAFAIDLEGMLLNTADAIAGNIIEGAGLGALCSPFQMKVKIALQNTRNVHGRTSDPYEASCTLSQATNNVDEFLTGNFSEGGWSAWFQMTQTRHGNPYAAYLDAKGTINSQIAKALDLEKEQLRWSNGFLNIRECEEYAEGSTAPEDCVKWGPTKTPGILLEGQLQKALGSEIAQLELADEFDEILSALMGQLMEVVFSPDGILNSTGQKNRNTRGGVTGRPNLGACMPNKTSVIVGDEVKWTFVGNVDGSTTIVWFGDEISGSGKEISVRYTDTGSISRSAGVRVTRITTLADGTTVTNEETYNCSDSVIVSRFAPLGLECTLKQGNVTVSPGAVLDWEVRITGGSGTLRHMDIKETESHGAPSKLPGAGQIGSGSYTTASNWFRVDPILEPFFERYNNDDESRYWFWNPRGIQSSSQALPPLPKQNGVILLNFRVTYPFAGTYTLEFSEVVDFDGSIGVLRDARCNTTITVI